MVSRRSPPGNKPLEGSTPPSSVISSRPKPWYRHVNLDLLILILVNSIFHPYIMFIFYLSQAALHLHKQPLAYYTLCYTAVLAVVEVTIHVNHRYTYGKHRKVDWEKEVVVITGGGSGLGRVLAEMMVRKGARVAILDVKAADEEAQDAMERWDLIWETCDVGNQVDVQRAVATIVDELGSPTILINNAATAITGRRILATPGQPMVLTPEQASKTLKTNALSQFNTLSALLPHLVASPVGAHVVTISSILSHLSPASLADYSASKTAISSLHHTLRHELSSHPEPSVFHKVKTLLVETGQLDTGLFAEKTSLPFYAEFFGPVLEASKVAKDIVKAIERGDGGVIRMPFYAKVMPLYPILPGMVQNLIRWFSGIDRAIGRGDN
ncbi:hypothetical protein PV10_01198 [Exophiala mesophila]|uniref:Uncharacterized protein n=1 Tax=Exophiala mesophila TaxID=212818 RepID=A0A0D1YA00_EXOME|nr:uncharacterized protein PV10_01198 [Exophiala mesophila]KIV97446.1 hypothetical protein PV10_01198 [Exophiala mesophila]